MPGYNSYFDDKYGNMQSDYAPETIDMSGSGGGEAAGSAAGSAGTAAMLSGGNPYAIGASFLLNYMAQKKKEFEDKRNREMAMAQNYANSQNSGLNSLQSAWARALGR